MAENQNMNGHVSLPLPPPPRSRHVLPSGNRCRMLVLVCDACVETRGQEKEYLAPGLLPGARTDTAPGSDVVEKAPAPGEGEGALTVAKTATASNMTAARQRRGAEVTGREGGRRDGPASAETVGGIRPESKEAAPHLVCSSCSRRG